MTTFKPIHTYGVTPEEYYRLSGVTKEDKIRHLEAEIGMLRPHLSNVRKWFRKRKYGSPESRYLQALYKHIERKLELKEKKLLSLRRK